MTRSEKFLAIVTLILMVLAFLPSDGFSQWNTDSYWRDDNDYNRGRALSTIKRLETRSDEFERRIRRDLDKKDYGWKKDDYLISLARDFERAADRLEDVYSSSRDLGKSYYEAQRVLSLGQQIDSVIYGYPVSRGTQKDWNRIREDLNRLANIYAYYNDDRTRRNRGNRSYKDDVKKYPRNDEDFPKKRKGRDRDNDFIRPF